jgi:hypothetical protein
MLTQTHLDHGRCVVCNTDVEVAIDSNGGLALVDIQGYSGLTDDGDNYVCRDHFCPVCGGYHLAVDEFDACQFTGAPDIDLTPPCSWDSAIVYLTRVGTMR